MKQRNEFEFEAQNLEYENVYNEISHILNDKKEYDKMSNAVNPYGDGKACDRIIDFIENLR